MLFLFALAMIAVGAAMLRPRTAKGNPDIRLTPWIAVRLIAIGLVVGAISGFFGVGGGFQWRLGAASFGDDDRFRCVGWIRTKGGPPERPGERAFVSAPSCVTIEGSAISERAACENAGRGRFGSRG